MQHRGQLLPLLDILESSSKCHRRACGDLAAMAGHLAGGVRNFAVVGRLVRECGWSDSPTIYSPLCAGVSYRKVVPLQVSQRIPCILPSTLISPDDTKPAVEPSGFIIAKKHPIYFTSVTRIRGL